MYYKNNIEKKLIVGIMIKPTMLKACAEIAIINMEEPKSHGIALTISFMPVACVKIAI
jgi:hypothetical protein